MTKTSSKVFIEDEKVKWEKMSKGVKRKIMAYDKNIMLVRVEFEQGAIGTLHSHYHSQVSHVESGRFEVEIGKEKKILYKGDAFYVAPDVVHGVVCLEQGVLLDVFSPMREEFIAKSIKE
jgi:quercetin dioxygenase-like cupin family protein